MTSHEPAPAPEEGAADGDQGWLDADQQLLWRRWLALGSHVPAALNRQLQNDSNLGLQDFDVLVHLTDVPHGRCRAGALALALQWERSRMSHHITRMEARGLVEREDCEEDRRGAFVQITPAGREAITSAAPAHVALVRTLMFDGASPEQLAVVSDFLARALDHVQARQQHDGVPVMPPPGAEAVAGPLSAPGAGHA